MRRTLPKSVILRGYQSFSRVIAGGATVSSAPIRAFYILNPAEDTDLKVGFSVSRTVRSAVQRNRAKRLMREAFRNHRAAMENSLGRKKGGLRLVLMYAGRGGATRKEMSLAAIESGVSRILSEIAKRI